MFFSIRVYSATFAKKVSRINFLKHTFRNIQYVNLSDIPNITVPDIKKVLRQRGLAVQDSCTSIIIKCSLCFEEQKEDESKVYINKATGYFLCPKCNIHGNWATLERIVKKSKLDIGTKELIAKLNRESEQFAKEWQATLENTVSINALEKSQCQELFKLFEFPFDSDVIKNFSDVRVNDERTALIFPLKNSLDKVVGYRKVQAGNEDKPECCGLHHAGLFKCKAIRSQRGDQAILVPSFQDILNLAIHKVPGNLIWLSNCTLPPIMLPTLDVYQKLYLWGDWNNMRSVAEKLGEDRCLFIRPTDGLVTASEVASAGLSLKDLIAEAKPAAHRSITTFAALRDDVYADLTNIDKVRGVKWQHFPTLTKLLGGHRRGELTVLTGPTGCGKTTLCAEMSLDLAQQGVTTLWGSFEIRNSRLARTMLQQFAGVPLEQNLQDFKKYADGFEKLPLYYLAFHGSQPIKVVMEAVEHARYMHDIAHVIVDNVQFMLGMGGVGGDKNTETGDRFYKQDAVIAAFRTFATTRHCHVTLVMHPRKERDSDDLSTSSIFGGAKASQEADNVLIIQDKRLTTVRGKKYLQVAKNRYSGDLGIVPLEFDKDALSYQTKKKNKTTKMEEGSSSNSESSEQELHKEYFSNYDDMITDRKVIHVSKTGLYKNKNGKLDDATDNYLRELLNLDKNR